MHSHKHRLNNIKTFYNLSTEAAQKAISLMDSYLNRGYTSQVAKRLFSVDSPDEVNPMQVRHVKNGSTNNSRIFKALIELATENRETEVAVQKLLDQSA